MDLFKRGKRSAPLKYIAQMGSHRQIIAYARVLNSLFEILPAGIDDHKQTSGLLTNKETLIRDAKGMIQVEQKQEKLDL
ncbi:MAG: hypothetical protein U5Q03_04140 [Bacteroidota bacterium]|nr:hypothetical protein [Bacteroidota bacterium]